MHLLTFPQTNDLLVVADCGGGTADGITYEINKPNPMTVQEAVVGEGASRSF